MDILPNELIVGILEKLNEQNLKTCLDVCYLWNDIVSDAIGVKRYIGNVPTNFKLDLLPCSDVKEIGEIGINSCMVFQTGDGELPNFYNSYLMKRLMLHCPITIQNYNKLAAPLENLRAISFHLETLNSFNFAESKAHLTFPKLKLFRIFGDATSGQFLVGLQSHDIIRANFYTLLLDTYFPRLDTLLLLYVPLLASTENDSSLEAAMIVFLTKHQYTLRTFGLLNSNDLKSSETIPMIPNTRNKVQLRLQVYDFFTDTKFGSHLDKFFQPIIASQTNLRHIMNYTTSSFSPNFIRQNSLTLVSLELGFHRGVDAVIDCKVFETCISLKYISLIGRINPSLPTRKRIITNTKFLPNTMTSIRIVDFILTSVDASELLTKEWSMLNYLELQNIGSQDNLGVEFISFCTLELQKNVEHIFISNGINEMSIIDLMDNNYEDLCEAFCGWPDLAWDLCKFFKITKTFDAKFCLDKDYNYVLMDWMAAGKYFTPDSPDHMYIHAVHIQPSRNYILVSMPLY